MKFFYYLKSKWVYILSVLAVLLIVSAVGGYIYFQDQLKTIDLTKGKVVDLKDNLGSYIEQVPEVCDQSNLSKYFKSFVIPGEAGKPTQSQFASLYGETIWNYILQGEIANIETVNNGIKYTLVSGEDKLITQATNKTISFIKDPTASPSSGLTPKNIDTSTFTIKDKVFLYYLVKCGGNKPPLLFLEYIQKISALTSNAVQSNPATLLNKNAKYKTYVPTKDLETIQENRFFTGMVLEKNSNSVTLKGAEEKTLKIYVNTDFSLLKVPLELDIPFNDYMHTNPQKISYSTVKKGDLLSLTVKLNKNLPEAIGGFIFR